MSARPRITPKVTTILAVKRDLKAIDAERERRGVDLVAC